MALSRVSLIIDMPTEQPQYCLVESCIQALICAASPEQVHIVTAVQDCECAISDEQAEAFLLYLSQQYFTCLNIALPRIVHAFFRTKEQIKKTAPSCVHSRKVLEQIFLSNMEPAFVYHNPYITDRAVQMISSQYASLSLENLAENLDISHSYLCRIISKDTGYSFLELLHFRRILAVISEFLFSTDTSTESLCLRLGYTSLHHFHRVFKQYTELTPANAKKLLSKYTYNGILNPRQPDNEICHKSFADNL